ncbi:hypothetical protein BDN72DRAFT_818822 [Pluteus cervinus]|uniref:Uncharacterized protein n=1 Tax=Pluteus cervinus TaxID=181527 RepID=A0ACD3AX54_9AGAR|nr:hypothetical protein BDN72DRAFT_818822 [Pluteus cervinus]
MLLRALLFSFPFLVTIVHAQSCDNFGIPNGSSCICPPGFGGPTCSEIGCGGNIFEGAQRLLTSATSGSFANITQSKCSCESGWGGVGCNVCQSSNACQVAFSSVTNSSASTSITGASGNGLNDTLTCNDTPRVWASGFMSCSVQNPTLQAVYPLDSTLNILRTLQPSLTPSPNDTSFGSAGTVYAQLMYAGEEQFYCQADSCAQTLGSGSGSSDWNCQNLKCTCRTNTTFCGGVPSTDLTGAIDPLDGTLEIECAAINATTGTSTCHFKQTTLNALFGQNGLVLGGCMFGECVAQNVIDTGSNLASAGGEGSAGLGSGVIAGLAVVGALVLLAVLLLILGLRKQRLARRKVTDEVVGRKIGLQWSDVSYTIPAEKSSGLFGGSSSKGAGEGDKAILDCVSGTLAPGQMMAILGPSGAGKTTLIELLARKDKSGVLTGSVLYTSESESNPEGIRIGFVPQQDVLPPMLTVSEALLFAARLRLPETVTDSEKKEQVDEWMKKLGIDHLKDTRIGSVGGGSKARGISGGEMRRVTIGLELIAKPDVLILDEPTSGLDSVSASRVAKVLHTIAHDPINPIAVIASIHQPSSQLYQTFDSIMLLSHGRSLYCGPGNSAPAEHFGQLGTEIVPECPRGYNVADYLLEIASDPPVKLFQLIYSRTASHGSAPATASGSGAAIADTEKNASETPLTAPVVGTNGRSNGLFGVKRSDYATTFLTQLECLSGREWKILRRDKSLFIAHLGISCVLGVFCGGLYFHTNDSIAGFQSRVGCLFFLGALIAFSSLSALYNVVESRPLFLRERSSSYYSPTAWLISRFFFDVIPLRIVPTIVVSTITYWMAGLAPTAANFFKFLFIVVLYTLAMTLFNFLLGAMFQNGGIAILLSALTALYQMTFAGFFVHLNAIPPVIRWLQWFAPLKYALEALSVNEVGSGLMIEDTLQGVPVSVSASLIMQILFGFGANNYYRDVLVLFAFIAGFAVGVIGIVWLRVREQR